MIQYESVEKRNLFLICFSQIHHTNQILHVISFLPTVNIKLEQIVIDLIHTHLNNTFPFLTHHLIVVSYTLFY